MTADVAERSEEEAADERKIGFEQRRCDGFIPSKRGEETLFSVADPWLLRAPAILFWKNLTESSVAVIVPPHQGALRAMEEPE